MGWTTRAAAFGGLVAALALGGCQSLYFFPDEEHYWDPADAGLEYEDVWFEAEDDLTLHGWLLPARTEEPRGTVLFFHGNAQNVSTHVVAVWWLPRQGFNVFIFDYRGFGKSEGRPDFDGVHKDARAAFRTLGTLDEVDPERVVVFGQSLGASVALTATARWEEGPAPVGIAAEAPFDSYRGIAREKLGAFWLTWPFQYPLSWPIPDEHAPRDYVADLAPIPLLLITGDQDRTIPPHHAERLLERAGEPRSLWVIEGADHNQPLADPRVRHRLAETFRAWLEGDADGARKAPEGPWEPDPPRP